MKNALWWNETPVLFTLSNRTTMALHIKQGVVEIRAPYHTPMRTAQSFIDQKSQWIGRTLEKQRAQHCQKIDFKQRTHIPFMGLSIALHHDSQQKTQWTMVPEGLKCSITPEHPQWLSLLSDFYQKQADFWLTKKTHQLADDLNLTKRLTDIRLRKTKTKWGHCTTQGRIQYNWQIMMAPETIINYLVAHEVCHLKYLNHSEQFWALVNSVHPTFKTDRRWLKENGHRFTLE